jgi:hypothetical protein
MASTTLPRDPISDLGRPEMWWDEASRHGRWRGSMSPGHVLGFAAVAMVIIAIPGPA